MIKLKISKTMKDVQWSFISLATAAFAHLLLRIVFGRELGPSGLGLYTLVFTIYMFGMQFAAFGIGAALTKYIAQYHDNQQRIKDFVSSGIAGSLVSGTVIGVLLFLFSGIISVQLFHIPEMNLLLKITAFCFPFIAMQKAVIGTLNGLRKMKLFAVVNIAQNMSVFIISIILVIIFDLGVIGAVIGFVAPTILIGFMSLATTIQYYHKTPKKFTSSLRQLSYFGFYIVLGTSISFINTEIDTLMIGYYLGEVEVGYYAVAIIFSQGIILLPHSIQRVTTPAISRYYGENQLNEIKNLVKNTMLKTFLFVILISLPLVIFGSFLIRLLFTEEYMPAYIPLLILLIGYSIYSPWVSVGTVFSSIDKVNIVFKINALCAIINTMLNFIFIPIFGIEGAAIATSLALIFTCLINIYFIRKYIYISFSTIKSS